MTDKRVIEAYKDGDITLAQRDAYLRMGKTLNSLISIGTPAGLTVGDIDMTGDKITSLGAATAEDDAANLSNIKHRVGKGTIAHDGGESQPICTVPANSRVDKITFVNTVEFDGTRNLGDAGLASRLLGDDDIPKAIGSICKLLEPHVYAAQTAIVMTFANCTTGAGTVYVDYTILP